MTPSISTSVSSVGQTSVVNSSATAIAIVVVVILVLIIGGVVVFVYFVYYKKKKMESNVSNPTIDSTLQTLGEVKDDRNEKQNFQKIEKLINDSNLKIESNEITKLGEIGRGAFGIVYKGIYFF